MDNGKLRLKVAQEMNLKSTRQRVIQKTIWLNSLGYIVEYLEVFHELLSFYGIRVPPTAFAVSIHIPMFYLQPGRTTKELGTYEREADHLQYLNDVTYNDMLLQGLQGS